MKLSQTRQFRKDMKRQIKQGKDERKLIAAVEILLSARALPTQYRDHPPKGQWKGRRDSHIELDWILIYRRTDSELPV